MNIPLHPRIVHFPVALLIGAAVFGILALIFKGKRKVFKEVLFWNLALGVAGAVVAIISGLLEEETLVHNDTIHAIMETHKLLGFIFSGILLALLIWMIFRKSKMKNIEFTGLVVILVLSAGLLGYSAHLGGKMVYKLGAGVVPMKEILSGEKAGHRHHHKGEEMEHHEENAADGIMEDSPEHYHDNGSYEQEESGHDHEHGHSSHEH